MSSAGEEKSLLTICCLIDDVPLLLETFSNELGQDAIIFDNKDFHDPTPVTPPYYMRERFLYYECPCHGSSVYTERVLEC